MFIYNGKYKSKHSHEMTRFWIWIAIWSSLHEPVRIFRSSNGSVFKSPVYRVHNEHQTETSATGLDLIEWICITVSRNHIQIERGVNTHHTGTHTCLHTCVHSHTYVNMSIHIYTHYINIPIHYTQIYLYTPHMQI